MNKIDKQIQRVARKRRSNSIKGTEIRPRVVLNETNLYLNVQVINDSIGHTLASSSTSKLSGGESISKKNKSWAKKLGSSFADKLKEKGISNIVFDRNSRKYHGKIEEFCEALRESGINF